MILLMIFASVCLGSMEITTSTAQPGSSLYIIEGWIFDENDNTVPNATIEIFNRDTGEVQLDNGSDNGGYSYLLSNLQEGWEYEHEIVITASQSVHGSVTVIPHDGEDYRDNVNITLPFLQIITPEAGETLTREGDNFTIQIEYLPSVNLSYIIYTLNSIEIANTSDETVDLLFKDYDDGTHKLRVTLTTTSGSTYSKEIFFKIESKDDGSDNMIFILAVLIVSVIVLIGLGIYVKMTSNPDAPK